MSKRKHTERDALIYGIAEMLKHIKGTENEAKALQFCEKQLMRQEQLEKATVEYRNRLQNMSEKEFFEEILKIKGL